MSGGRRHVGRPVRQRDVQRAEQRASSPDAVRRDVMTRYAIMRGAARSSAVWWCVQSNGRAKPGYRTLAVATRVAELLALHGETKTLVVYRCTQVGNRAIAGEHFHLASPMRLTPPDKGRRVSVISEKGTPSGQPLHERDNGPAQELARRRTADPHPGQQDQGPGRAHQACRGR